jgi:hypothetical protein
MSGIAFRAVELAGWLLVKWLVIFLCSRSGKRQFRKSNLPGLYTLVLHDIPERLHIY